MELPRDKNGEVIRIGDTMYDRDGNGAIVDKVCSGGCFVGTGYECFLVADGFTHVKPDTFKPDTWERIEKDCSYIDGPADAKRIVKRCKKLAGVD